MLLYPEAEKNDEQCELTCEDFRSNKDPIGNVAFMYKSSYSAQHNDQNHLEPLGQSAEVQLEYCLRYAALSAAKGKPINNRAGS